MSAHDIDSQVLNLNFNLESELERPSASFNFNADYARMLLHIQMACSNNPYLLDSIANLIATSVRSATDNCLFKLTDESAFHQLRDVGFGQLRPILSPQQLTEIHDFLSNMPVYAAHNAAYASHGTLNRSELRTEPQLSYKYEDLIRTPHVLELAVNPHILGVVSNYLGCLPIISEINLLWSNPAGRVAKYGQTYHRDLNDFKWVTMFVYLTDVDTNSGPHCFIPGTHRMDLFTNLLQQKLASPTIRQVAINHGIDLNQLPMSAYEHSYQKLDKFYDAAFKDCTHEICGPAGTVILEDSKGLHFGKPPFSKERLTMWVVYGMYKNNCNIHSTLKPLPFSDVSHRISSDSATRYVTQLMFPE